jgi:hypothetical protein
MIQKSGKPKYNYLKQNPSQNHYSTTNPIWNGIKSGTSALRDRRKSPEGCHGDTVTDASNLKHDAVLFVKAAYVSEYIPAHIYRVYRNKRLQAPTEIAESFTNPHDAKS